MFNVLDHLTRTAKEYPDKPAFVDKNGQLTFGELKDRADSIGTAILAAGCVKEPVAVYMNKSPEEVAAFLGTVAAGCCYVPIDSEMPAVRIKKIFESCDMKVCIVDKETVGEIGKLDFKGKVLLYDEICHVKHDEVALKKAYDSTIDTDPLYIFFTSGSTGVPKGVVVSHRGLIAYIDQLTDVLGVTEENIFGNQTPLYFDASLKDVYPTLKCGATTYFIPKELFSMPLRLVEYLNEKKINTICWVVSALTIVSAFKTFEKVKPETLKTVVFGGEVFTAKHFNIWRSACPEARFVNLYGPTEGTGVCCVYYADRMFKEDEAIPIGRPFRNTRIYLLNEKGEEAKPGEEGEICLSGTGVSLGYYNDPERTAASFVQNPFQKNYPEFIYKTGDIAKYDQNGDLVFVSRRDNQIKHMGHRIELGEVEAAVLQVEGVVLAGCAESV